MATITTGAKIKIENDEYNRGSGATTYRIHAFTRPQKRSVTKSDPIRTAFTRSDFTPQNDTDRIEFIQCRANRRLIWFK